MARKKVLKNKEIKQGEEASRAEDKLLARLEECDMVIEHLKTCPAWVVIKNDLKMGKDWVDDNWQDITDELKLKNARVIKLAYKHVIEISEKYIEDRDSILKNIKMLTSTDKEIIKDYDSE